MIKTTELRIGNWVYDGKRTQFPMFIQTVAYDYVYLDFPGNEGDVFESESKELEGIPITPDILVDSGFENLGWCFTHEDLDLRLIKQDWGWEFLCVTIPIGKPIHFVHELQNIFYDLTKKALNIKL